MFVDRCRLIDLPTRTDARGSLTVLEEPEQIPFSIRRVYYLHHTPDGAKRGAHAHRALEQVFLAPHGGYTLRVDDGRDKRVLVLDRPDVALYVPPMLWRDLDEFTPGAVCMVFASAPYDEGDYIRSYDAFVTARASLPSSITDQNR